MDENQIPIEALVHDLVGRVDDKWTTLILELWAGKDMLRFTRLSERGAGISQKCLGRPSVIWGATVSSRGLCISSCHQSLNMNCPGSTSA